MMNSHSRAFKGGLSHFKVITVRFIVLRLKAAVEPLRGEIRNQGIWSKND